MAEVQLKRKITLRRKEKPAEFTFDGLLKVKLLWQSKTDLDLCIFFKRIYVLFNSHDKRYDPNFDLST